MWQNLDNQALLYLGMILLKHFAHYLIFVYSRFICISQTIQCLKRCFTYLTKRALIHYLQTAAKEYWTQIGCIFHQCGSQSQPEMLSKKPQKMLEIHFITILLCLISISPFLKPIPKNIKEDLKPFCSYSVPSASGTLDHLTVMILKQKLPNSPEIGLAEWLILMTGDQQATVRQLGTKISIALKEVSLKHLLLMYVVTWKTCN